MSNDTEAASTDATETTPAPVRKASKSTNSATTTAAYDAKADQLAEMFANNFEKYRETVSDAVRAAGPTRQTA